MTNDISLNTKGSKRKIHAEGHGYRLQFTRDGHGASQGPFGSQKFKPIILGDYSKDNSFGLVSCWTTQVRSFDLFGCESWISHLDVNLNQNIFR